MSQAIEPWLTRDDRKRAVYLDDPYFWEGWASYHAARPTDRALTRLTFLLVKPEAIAGRRVEPILEFVRSAGFLVIGTWPVRMGRHEARNLWRYSLNELPIAHIRALEMLVTAGQLFLVGLSLGRDACLDLVASGQVTAAELLSRAKGSTSRPEAPGTLRQRLGCPALTLNFVHAPDEPADMLRELAVLGDANLQEQVIARLLAARDWPLERFDAMRSEAAAIMTSQYALCPAHDLDVAATFERMRRCLRDRPLPTLGPAMRYAIETGTVSPERGLEVIRSLELATELPMWDRVVTAASLVDDLRTGRRPLVELWHGERGADRRNGSTDGRLNVAARRFDLARYLPGSGPPYSPRLVSRARCRRDQRVRYTSARWSMRTTWAVRGGLVDPVDHPVRTAPRGTRPVHGRAVYPPGADCPAARRSGTRAPRTAGPWRPPEESPASWSHSAREPLPRPGTKESGASMPRGRPGSSRRIVARRHGKLGMRDHLEPLIKAANIPTDRRAVTQPNKPGAVSPAQAGTASP